MVDYLHLEATMRFKNIIFPTDFSESSLHALHVADEIADKFNSQLQILHVIYDMVAYADAAAVTNWYPAMYVDLEKAAKEELHKVAKKVKFAKDPQLVVRRGVEETEIIRYADEQKADLIVMGTHGRTGVGRLLLGSTAEQVLRHAHCPVLTVRSDT